MGKRPRFSWWLTAALVAVLFAVVGVWSLWSATDQREASEAKVLGEARLLAQQMSAAWDYIDSSQDAINYNADGRYDFKGVYCSVAGKSIARNFTQSTDCVVRYTRENPRTGPDAPDEFEAAALAAFRDGARSTMPSPPWTVPPPSATARPFPSSTAPPPAWRAGRRGWTRPVFPVRATSWAIWPGR